VRAGVNPSSNLKEALMKKSLILFAILSLVATATVPANAQVRQVEIDVAGYLCGL